MPITIEEAVGAQASAAAAKADQLKRHPAQYLTQTLLAGAYVGVAVVLLIMVSASFVKAGSVATKLVQGSVFGVALTLVVFAGAELFTGVVMSMIQGLMAKTVKVVDLIAIWVTALVGNFIGAAVFSGIVAASGIITVGGTKKEAAVYFTALAGVLKAKTALTGAQLFWRAVLCNFLVCLGLWMAARASSDSAKLICLFWALLAFVASGFEHSVANMTFFFLGIFTHAPHGTLGGLLRNLLYTVPGNIVGGGLLVAAAYSFSGRTTMAAGSGSPSLPGWMDAVPAPAAPTAGAVPAVATADATSAGSGPA